MTIADKINTLATIRADQAALLQARGETVPDTWGEYADAFDQLVGGVGWEDWLIAQMEGRTDLRYAFYGWENLTSVPLFDTSNVVNMSNTFQYCSSLVEVPLFDTSSVTNMSSTFRGCSSLTEIPQLDAASVTSSMQSTFTDCSSLERMQIAGIRVRLNITGAQMGAAALNEVFTNMGTPRGTGTNAQIDVRYNPGSSTCDPTIANAKGWTVLR